MIRQLTLAALLAASLAIAAPARADDPQALAVAMRAVGAGDWDKAQSNARIAGPIAFDIVEWHRLRAGEGAFVDYADFSRRRADWPGMELLRRKGEATLAGAPADQVIAYFSHGAPQTGEGAIALVEALQATGQAERAGTVAAVAWRNLEMSADEQAAFVARHGDLLAEHHGGRMQAMLDAGALDQARRMLDLVTPGTRAVAAARIALQAREKGVDSLVAAVPERMLGSPGLALDRAMWRWRNDLEGAAADLVLERSADAQSLGDPKLWSKLRGNLARWFLRAGDARTAYKVAARHRLGAQGGDYAELEWLAGYAALKLGDAPVALQHFEAFSAAVQSPISASRGAYWRGRALERLGKPVEAQAAYTEGARWQTAFYGLLSAERAGVPLDPAFAAPPALPDWRQGSYTGHSVFQAALLLNEAGQEALAERFLLHLEESLPTDQIAPLADLALEWKNAYLALSLAKRAANEGGVLVSAYYPIPDLTTHDLGVPEELALSIARRESEFDPAVVSHAGARGLMQLMPGTAKMMAAQLGLPYEAGRLTSDPTYNARLGGAYLAKLRDEFGASPVLVAAGYNAGPGRPRRWIEERGDPRLPTADVVDWIEMIPFTETRNYVMRVAESLPVYRARLGKPAVKFSDELRGLAP
ncbi:lytic transglycosylase domain-containing protein [Sinirhodobacter sp. HNIBRBA609]|nr:lytic transglycosylase domain-containing protein [Sinirhodobacter sp. HNIBRBA609]